MEPEWVAAPSIQDENAHSEDKLFRKEKSPNRARRKRGRQQANMVAVGAPFSKIVVSALGYRGRVGGVDMFTIFVTC